MQQANGGASAAGPWDTSYEWKAVTLLGIGFGLVGLDRWIIASLLPLGMAADLGLDVQDGGNRNPRTYQFLWAGKRYAARGRPVEVSDFTVHPYEGRDLIVQARAQRPLRPYFYALARKLADGVYFVTVIDPNDADDATRDRFCIKTRDAPCRIETPEQLFVFARATAAKEAEQGKLAVLVRPGKR